MKERLDSTLVRAGVAKTLADARALIRAGRVMVCHHEKKRTIWSVAGCKTAANVHQSPGHHFIVGDRTYRRTASGGWNFAHEMYGASSRRPKKRRR